MKKGAEAPLTHLQILLFESVDARHVITGNEQVDVVCSLVGDHGFEVHHVAHDRVFARDTHSAMDLTRFPSDLERHVDVVAFGHGDLLGSGAVLILEHAESPAKELRLGDLGDHLGKFLLWPASAPL